MAYEGMLAETVRVLNDINPDYIRSRPLFPSPGSPLIDAQAKGEFQMMTPREQLIELRLMIKTLNVTSKVCFDHALNFWQGKQGGLLFSQSYEGYQFPDEKPRVLELIEEGIEVQKDTPIKDGIGFRL